MLTVKSKVAILIQLYKQVSPSCECQRMSFFGPSLGKCQSFRTSVSPSWQHFSFWKRPVELLYWLSAPCMAPWWRYLMVHDEEFEGNQRICFHMTMQRYFLLKGQVWEDISRQWQYWITNFCFSRATLLISLRKLQENNCNSSVPWEWRAETCDIKGPLRLCLVPALVTQRACEKMTVLKTTLWDLMAAAGLTATQCSNMDAETSQEACVPPCNMLQLVLIKDKLELKVHIPQIKYQKELMRQDFQCSAYSNRANLDTVL